MATPRICSIPDCNKPAVKRGWCNAHYLRWWRHGDETYEREQKACAVQGCADPARSLGWCLTHYGRWRRHGDPLKTGRAQPTKTDIFLKETALPYTGDECLIWPFSWRLQIDGASYIPSRFVCEKVHGPAPTPDHEAAHSCGNGHLKCVTPNHLRWATRLENTLDKCAHGSVKLSPDDVREIRRLAGALPQGQIASRYGVDQSLISYIKNGRAWGWVE